MRGYKKLLFLPLFFSAASLFAQLSFTIKIEDKEIGRADILQVEYVANNATGVSDFKQPVFADWTTVMGPEYSQQSVSINGKSQSSISYVFMLSPKKTGTLVVPGTTITADGKQLSCSAASVHVSVQQHVASAQPQQNLFQFPSIPADMMPSNDLSENNILKPGENPTERIHKNIFVKLVANKTTCFVGEPVLVTYQLFAAMQTQAKVNKIPSFTGCSVIEMTSPDEHPAMQTINGKAFKVYTIRKVQLIPLQEGDLKLDTASIDNEVTFSSPNDPYQTQNYTATSVSNSLTIHVLPLPEKNKPADFSGALGTFSITAKADSSSIALGENNNLQIVISGQGNFNGILKPAVQWPAGLQHFDGSDSQQVDKTVFPVSGNKFFNVPFIGVKKGADTIPPISFSFFDPATKSYQTVHTGNVIVQIKPALQKSERLKDIIVEDISNRQYLWIVGAMAVAVAFVFLFTNKKAKIKVAPAADKKEEKVNEEAAKPVEPLTIKTDFSAELNTLERLTDNRAFFTKAKSMLTLALQEKVGMPLNNTPVPTLLSILLVQTNDQQLVNDAQNIYTVCDRSLYSPIVSDEEKASLHLQLTSVIKRLEV